ncbi:MAG: hypothetical protein JST75_14665 [Bacteroidetes bacterium]|nr:hypothetical protein [Bacteroidota bacterium]
MFRNKTHLHIIFFACLIFCTQMMSNAQAVIGPSGQRDTDSAKKSGEYALVLYMGGGVSFFTGDAGTPAGLKATKTLVSPIATFRIMWQPDHLLRVGLESGWTNFYSYSIEDNSVKGKVHVQSIPLLLVFSMPVFQRFNIYAGPGSYLVTSKLNYETRTTSTTLSLGWMAAVSFEYPLTSKLGIVSELKFLNSWETKDQSLSLQIHLRWKFLTW